MLGSRLGASPGLPKNHPIISSSPSVFPPHLYTQPSFLTRHKNLLDKM